MRVIGKQRWIERIDARPIQMMGGYPYAPVKEGNTLPDTSADAPRLGYSVLYEVARGFGINRSLSRLSGMVGSEKQLSVILDRYEDIRRTEPSDGKYRDLMKAVAGYYDFGYEYVRTDNGHLLKMWDDEGVEWQFPIRRGESRQRDYKKSKGYLYDTSTSIRSGNSKYPELYKSKVHDVNGK